MRKKSKFKTLDSIMENCLKADGTEPNKMRDYCFMLQRTIEDPDGHTSELFCMDITKFQG